MRCALALLMIAVMALAAIAKESESPTELPLAPVLLILYSPSWHRTVLQSEFPGRGSWFGHLWVDHRKIGLIVPGKFVTLKMPEGDHIIAGERAINGIRFGAARESGIQTAISLHRGTRYFMRLTVDSKQIAGFGPLHYIAEPVTCQEAYREAATLEPVKLKRIQRSSLDSIARESYFSRVRKVGAPHGRYRRQAPIEMRRSSVGSGCHGACSNREGAGIPRRVVAWTSAPYPLFATRPQDARVARKKILGRPLMGRSPQNWPYHPRTIPDPEAARGRSFSCRRGLFLFRPRKQHEYGYFSSQGGTLFHEACYREQGCSRVRADALDCRAGHMPRGLREAAALEPVKLKRIERSSLDYIARESYFPECGR
jgi:hypothetical protein